MRLNLDTHFISFFDPSQTIETILSCFSERNREHAKRSRIRKKFLLESLQQSVAMLKEENDKLRESIRHHIGDEQAEVLLAEKMDGSNGDMRLTTSSQGAASKVLDDPDFSFIKALQTAQQNFVVTLKEVEM